MASYSHGQFDVSVIEIYFILIVRFLITTRILWSSQNTQKKKL